MKIKIKGVECTPNQDEIYRVLRRFGPLTDTDLISITRHVFRSSQSHSGIRTRRHELGLKGLIQVKDEVLMPSGRTAMRFKVVR